MQYHKVSVRQIAYALPKLEVTTEELEAELAEVYKTLHIPQGQIESLSGIKARRWWPKDFKMWIGARQAAERALQAAAVSAQDIDMIVYTGVCRDFFEPATACRIGAELGLRPEAIAYDLSNACLGVMNGICDVANRIELGQIEAGLVVSCETAREIVEDTIQQLHSVPTMERFKSSLATFTGGSGAVAVLVTARSSRPTPEEHLLLGGAHRSSLSHHHLCRWGLRKTKPHQVEQFTETDAAEVLRHGLMLGRDTYRALHQTLGWEPGDLQKAITHQVGRAHQEQILKVLEIPSKMDYSTYETLGNMGTVSLPLTAAMAAEQGFLAPGNRVGFLGIGSGLNCFMMGVQW